MDDLNVEVGKTQTERRKLASLTKGMSKVEFFPPENSSKSSKNITKMLLESFHGQYEMII